MYVALVGIRPFVATTAVGGPGVLASSGTPPGAGDRFVGPSGASSGGGASGDSVSPVRKLLVVDDEPLVARALIRGMASLLGIGREDIFTAQDMASALAVFAAHPGEVLAVITDVDMASQGEGFRLHESLRDSGFDGPVVITSGRCEPTDPEPQAAMARHSKTRFFRKPFSLTEVADWIRDRW